MRAGFPGFQAGAAQGYRGVRAPGPLRVASNSLSGLGEGTVSVGKRGTTPAPRAREESGEFTGRATLLREN